MKCKVTYRHTCCMPDASEGFPRTTIEIRVEDVKLFPYTRSYSVINPSYLTFEEIGHALYTDMLEVGSRVPLEQQKIEILKMEFEYDD